MTIPATYSLIEQINEAPDLPAAVDVFERIVRDVGIEHHCITFLPRAGTRIESVAMSWNVPPEWRHLYSSKNFLHSDPAVRHAGRTILPFDWISAPYDAEREPERAEVIDRARDFRMHDGVVIPVPSPSGIVGSVWVAGSCFRERESYKPMLHALALHTFHRLQRLKGEISQGGDLTSERAGGFGMGVGGKDVLGDRLSAQHLPKDR